MFFKPFELRGHRQCPHKTPSNCNTSVIPMLLNKFCPQKNQYTLTRSHTHAHTHTHTHTHTLSHTHTHTRTHTHTHTHTIYIYTHTYNIYLYFYVKSYFIMIHFHNVISNYSTFLHLSNNFFCESGEIILTKIPVQNSPAGVVGSC